MLGALRRPFFCLQGCSYAVKGRTPESGVYRDVVMPSMAVKPESGVALLGGKTREGRVDVTSFTSNIAWVSTLQPKKTAFRRFLLSKF